MEQQTEPREDSDVAKHLVQPEQDLEGRQSSFCRHQCRWPQPVPVPWLGKLSSKERKWLVTWRRLPRDSSAASLEGRCF